MTATLTRLDADQVIILSAYGSGDSIAQICVDANLSRQLVANTVDRFAKYDRGRARQLVADHEAAQSMHRRRPEPVERPEPQPEPEVEPEPAPVEPEADLEPEPADDDQDDERPEPDREVDVNTLLNAASAYADSFPYIGKLVGRIWQAVDELAPAVEAASKEAAARAKVDRLRAQLAKAEAELRQVAQPTGRESTLPAGVTAKAIRAWAAEAGVECAPIGKVPHAVVEAYVAAHPEVHA